MVESQFSCVADIDLGTVYNRNQHHKYGNALMALQIETINQPMNKAYSSSNCDKNGKRKTRDAIRENNVEMEKWGELFGKGNVLFLFRRNILC